MWPKWRIMQIQMDAYDFIEKKKKRIIMRVLHTWRLLVRKHHMAPYACLSEPNIYLWKDRMEIHMSVFIFKRIRTELVLRGGNTVEDVDDLWLYTQVYYKRVLSVAVFFFLFLIKLNIKKLSGKLSKLGFLGESLSECNIYGASCIGAAVTDE